MKIRIDVITQDSFFIIWVKNVSYTFDMDMGYTSITDCIEYLEDNNII